MYVENIVIGNLICSPESILSKDYDDWNRTEKEKTYFTNERYLPRILVSLGLYPSISKIKRNRPDLMIDLNDFCFIAGLKIKKKT